MIMKLAFALAISAFWAAACGGSKKQVESEREPFNCKDRADHDPGSAAVASARTRAFLERYLEDRAST